MLKPIKRWELVELIVPNGTTGRVTFQTIPQLRNQADQIIKITNIDVFSVSTYSNSQLTSTLPGLPAAEVPKAVLVLYVNGEESVKMIPLSKLIHTDDFNTTPFQEQIDGFDDLTMVDFDKSYVQYSVASANGPYIIPFGVNYLRFVKQPNAMPLNTSAIPAGWINS